MPWYAPWSDMIKKKVCRYLLQRYLGQFLEEKLSLEQLSVDFYRGTGTVSNVTLYSQALNELCESQGWGIEVTGGRIGLINVNVPWNALMSEDSFIEVTDLYISMKPQARHKDGTSMLESMWSSMSSSMQLAQECLEKEADGATATQINPMEGLERFAQTIDNVLNRIKARFINTELRLEYLTRDSNRGVALIIKIRNLEYQNEAGGDPPDTPTTKDSESDNQREFSISTYSTHHITMEGITFYTEEFRIINGETVPLKPENTTVASEQFYSTISELPEIENLYSKEKIYTNEAEEEQSDSDSDDDNDSSEIYSSEQILLGQISGTQEIRIKMKQTENIQGPKVQLEVTIGALNFFMCPRQFHLLVLFSDLFFDNTSPTDKPKNLTDDRSSSIASEIELKKQLGRQSNPMTGSIGLNQGWSLDPLDTNLSNVITNQPMLQRPSTTEGYPDSVFSSNSSMTSSMCSSMSQSTQNTNRARKRGIIDADPNADISSLNIRVACCAIVLLHEDILVESSSPTECPLSDESVKRLKLMSDEYFSSVGALNIGLGPNEILNADKLLDKSCTSNHLRLLLAPIIIEGEEQRNASGNLLRLSVSIARAELKEVLKDISVPLLEFQRAVKPGGLAARSEITLGIKQTTHTVRGTGGRRFTPPKTEINISLAPCTTEIDISLADRLNPLLNSSPFYTESSLNSSETTNSKTVESKIDIKIQSESVDARFRFPIADLRPIHDPERIPWWKRNVRTDYLLLNLIQMRMSYSLPFRCEIAANELNLFYCECEEGQKIALGKSVLLEKPGTRFSLPSIEYPKLGLEIPPLTTLQNVTYNRSSDDSDGAPSLEHIGISLSRDKEYSPFSSKRVCRESDTPHSKQTSDDSNVDVIPGDKSEMNKFCDEATKSSRIQIKVFLPVVSLQLKSKHLYEVLYNRINSDLLLWEPCAPMAAKHQTVVSSVANSLLNVGMMESIYAPFAMCKSGINYDSSSTTNSESEAESDNIYYSVYDRKKTKRAISAVTSDNTSAISFQLNIGQGMLTMYAPVRDTQNHVIPGQLGEFVIKINSAVIFSVNGYNGNEDLGYVCLQASSAELYHFGLIPVPSPDPPIRLIGCVLPTHMQSTLYPSPKNISQCETKQKSNREMISLAVQIKSCPDQRIKKIKISAGIQQTTLRHHPALPEHTWLTQLIDMFDVVDYAVQGYTPLGVVTEMHLHLWDCVIDYRPRYLAYRTIISVGTFIMSSNISTASSGCTLRFIAEECTMCLAPQKPLGESKTITDNKITVLPASELVCVLDLGLFEISLRLNDKATVSFPKFDMRASINGVHLRTCSDSAAALAQLIMYLAAEGDLVKQYELVDEDESTSKEQEPELLPMKPNTQIVPEVSESQQKRVNTLMEEAMKESLRIVPQIPEEIHTVDQDVEVFFFPDENLQIQKTGEPSNDSLSMSTESTPTLARSESVKSMDSDNKRKTSLSFKEDERSDQRTTDSDSVNTEMRDLLDFETSMMALKTAMDTDSSEPLPQVATELGNIIRTRPMPAIRKKSSDTDDDFCIIADEEKPKFGYEEVETITDPIRIVDNHFSIPSCKPDLLKAPPNFPMAVMRYTLCEMTLTWHIFGGHDFPTTSDKSKESKNIGSGNPSSSRLPMSDAYKLGVSYSKGSPNIIFGSGTQRKHTWREKGGVNRKHDVLMEVQINKARFSHETYPKHKEQASRQVLLISEIEIRDRLAVSNIKKFLYLPHPSKKGSQHMLVIKALHLRPDPSLTAQECCLRISLLPLRLNIDQDSLLFLVEFFNEIGGESNKSTQNRRQSSTPSHQPPIMMVDVHEATQEFHARKLVEENLMLLMEDEVKEKETSENVYSTADNLPIYFRNVVFSPDVLISLDYHGKKIELSHGPLAGLLMGLGQLHCSEIRLKRLCHRHGILGVDRLFNFLLQEWLQDIKSNQLSSVLKGVGAMYTFVQLFQGIKDLFWLPIEQYQKDGRIVRGLQLGAQSFTARTALAALEITTRIIYLLQITAETAYDMVSPGPSVRRIHGNRKGKRKRIHPPQDIREGVSNAFHIVKEGVGDTAHTIVEMATLEHDQKGYTGAVGAVIRQIPPTVVKPIVLATQATTNVLGGVRNQLIPDARREAKEKWKDDEE